MRLHIALTMLVLLGCARPQPERGRPSPATHSLAASQTQMIPMEAQTEQVDAGPPALVLTSATCADTDLITRMTPALAAGAEIICNMTDGGVGFTIRPQSTAHRRLGMALAVVIGRAVRNMNERARRGECAGEDRDSVSDRERWVSAPMIFRAPDRTLGKQVAIDGVVGGDVHEHEGHTVMTVATDMLGRESFHVVYPFLADDEIVSGARVRVYGTYVDSATIQSPLGDRIEPVIYAHMFCMLRGQR